MMNQLKTYKQTVIACYIGYVTQAIVNNFAPLLFIYFMSIYHISLKMITLVTTVNFLVQLATDSLSIYFVDKYGYRRSSIAAHVLCIMGFVLLTILPEIMDSLIGILISVLLYAIGGGLIEVLISPIIEECPSDNKEGMMSLLHSFYCWGHLGVIVLSSLFFTFIGLDHWRSLAYLWCIVPAFNIINFMFVPINTAPAEKVKSVHHLYKDKRFYLFILLMFLAGSSEQAMSQWASSFAEKGLHISKEISDLLGPGLFALFMGTARALYGKYSDILPLEKGMIASAILCVISYLMASLVPYSFLALAGCALCGFSVGLFWPGTLSMAAGMNYGGTAFYALLALSGDLGCSIGPTAVGFISGMVNDDLKIGLLSAVLFPLTIIIILSNFKEKHS